MARIISQLLNPILDDHHRIRMAKTAQVRIVIFPKAGVWLSGRFSDYRFTIPIVFALVVPGFPRLSFLHLETAQTPRLQGRGKAGRARQPRPPVNKPWLPEGCILLL